MTEGEFKQRTKQFALDVILLTESLPRTQTAAVLGKQLLRCATSVGANYRAACRAQSPVDMIAKLAIVEEEADECSYWLELLVESATVPISRVAGLMQESNELTAMIVSSKRTLKARLKDQESSKLK